MGGSLLCEENADSMYFDTSHFLSWIMPLYQIKIILI